jgi:predicted dehydrogenase
VRATTGAFKVAVIGAGNIANWGHGPSLQRYAQENPGVELAACCDLDPAKAKKFQEAWGFRQFYTDSEAMLAVEKPDAVFLLVDETAACRLAVPLLERGIPLFMEKPPGANAGETQRLVEAAAKGKGANAVAFNRRSMPLVDAFRDRVREVGVELTQIRYEMIRSARTEDYFYVTAIHGLDLVLHLAGSSLVESHIRRQAPRQAPAGAFHFDVAGAFASGLQAQWIFSPMAGVVFERFSAHGWGHSLYVHLPVWGCLDSPGSVEHYQDNRCVWRVNGAELSPTQEPFVTNGFFAETKGFLDRVRQGRPQRDTLASALVSAQFADALGAGREHFP